MENRGGSSTGVGRYYENTSYVFLTEELNLRMMWIIEHILLSFVSVSLGKNAKIPTIFENHLKCLHAIDTALYGFRRSGWSWEDLGLLAVRCRSYLQAN